MFFKALQVIQNTHGKKKEKKRYSLKPGPASFVHPLLWSTVLMKNSKCYTWHKMTRDPSSLWASGSFQVPTRPGSLCPAAEAFRGDVCTQPSSWLRGEHFPPEHGLWLHFLFAAQLSLGGGVRGGQKGTGRALPSSCPGSTGHCECRWCARHALPFISVFLCSHIARYL